MDPVAVVLIGIVAVAAAPKVLPFLGYGAIKLFEKISKKIEKKKKKKNRRNRQLQEKVANTKEVSRAIQKSGIMEFINTSTRKRKNVAVNESSAFDLNSDVLLRGVVRVRLKDGRIAEDDIYLFQPRVYGANNVPIGPKLNKNGNLLDENGYLVRLPGEEGIFRGYLPKREVISGERFDFVRDSKYSDPEDPLREFIDIDIPKDKDGNYIPVDKNNPQQMAAFRKYVDERKRHNIDQQAYLEDLIDAAKDSKETYDFINRPRYAKPIEGVSEKDIQRIQRVRASKAKREAQAQAYYGTINRMNMLDNIMHEYNLDEHASHLPGMGVYGGPRQGLGPGMPSLSSMHGPVPGTTPDGPSQGGRSR